MEVVDFYPTKFNDIPDQDNPAFDATEECIVVCADVAIGDRVMVLHIVPDPVESVNRIAMFWHHAPVDCAGIANCKKLKA